MNRWNAKVLWGFGLILFGLALTARELELITFRVFFPGWWTLFIIIPCVKSIIQRKDGIITQIGLGLGLLLLLRAQGFVSLEFGTLFVAIIFLVVGLSLIFKKPHNNHDRAKYSENVRRDTVYDNVHDRQEEYDKDDTKNYNSEYEKQDTINYDDEYKKEENKKEDKEYYHNYNEQNKTNRSYHGGSNYTALFSANNYQYVNEEFRGATIHSILGNVQLDLRNAIIYGDTVIDVTCILGGIDIYVPSNIRIINQCTAILAGVDSNVMSPRNMSENSYTIYIKGNCLLGGIEIK
jgi:predicted membrane protein